LEAEVVDLRNKVENSNKFLNRSTILNEILDNQISPNDKSGLGYKKEATHVEERTSKKHEVSPSLSKDVLMGLKPLNSTVGTKPTTEAKLDSAAFVFGMVLQISRSNQFNGWDSCFLMDASPFVMIFSFGIFSLVRINVRKRWYKTTWPHSDKEF
jgi:hypothetical protein